MRRILAATVTGLVVTATATLAVAPADASAPKRAVTIHAISTKTVPTVAPTSTVNVKPLVSRKGRVVVTSKSITVTQGSRTLANHAKSATLKGGSYRVTTRARYRAYTYVKSHGKTVRHYSAAKTKALTQILVINRPCATEAEFATVKTSGPFDPENPATGGDTVAQVAKKLHSNGVAGEGIPQPGFSERDYPKCDEAQANPLGVLYDNGVATATADFTTFPAPEARSAPSRF